MKQWTIIILISFVLNIAKAESADGVTTVATANWLDMVKNYRQTLLDQIGFENIYRDVKEVMSMTS
jgi:hypothetical protein